VLVLVLGLGLGLGLGLDTFSFSFSASSSSFLNEARLPSNSATLPSSIANTALRVRLIVRG